MIETERQQAGWAFERLLSEDEAIETLGLKGRPNPKGSLRWLMRTKRLAYVKLARGVYGFHRSDLAALVTASHVPASGPRKLKEIASDT